MPDRGKQNLYQVEGVVTGANWRAAKFVSPVPPQHTCSLCRVISRVTWLLPCFHALCESCLNTSVEEGSSLCPLDDKRFAEGECQRIQLRTHAAENLKACCWNEAQGCTFVGTLQDILTHYEQQCIFHAVSCPRCNERVLQKDLPRHYKEGCNGGTAGSATENATLRQGLELSAEDMRTCVEELKALIRDPYQDKLPALQSQMNELLEQARDQGARMEAISQEFIECENRIRDHFSEDIRQLSTTFSQELESHHRVLSARPRNSTTGVHSTAADCGGSETSPLFAGRVPYYYALSPSYRSQLHQVDCQTQVPRFKKVTLHDPNQGGKSFEYWVPDSAPK